VVRDGERARCHDASEETLQANLANEINKVSSEAEWHASRCALKITLFNLLHVFSLECLRWFMAQFESWLAEAEAASTFTEAHLVQ
jgi:hypothetical protein